MPQVDRKLIEHVALLGRLRLGEAEFETYSKQLQGILSYFDQLSTLDVSSVEPLVHALESVNVLREDRVHVPMPLAQALANAPDRLEMFFRVPKVIGEEQ